MSDIQNLDDALDITAKRRASRRPPTPRVVATLGDALDRADIAEAVGVPDILETHGFECGVHCEDCACADKIESLTNARYKARMRYAMALDARLQADLRKIETTKRAPSIADLTRLANENHRLFFEWIDFDRDREKLGWWFSSLRQIADAQARWDRVSNLFEIAQQQRKAALFAGVEIKEPRRKSAPSPTLIDGEYYIRTGYTMIDGVRVPTLEKIK